MNEVTINPLTEVLLEGAAWLCLHEAACTDLDEWPLQLPQLACHEHHQRRRRFQEALTKMRDGVTSLTTLGLSYQDCLWAANQYKLAKDQENWRLSFEAASQQLKPKEVVA